MRSVTNENKAEVTNKTNFHIRIINNYYYNFDILSDVINLELRWEDYGTGNRVGWCSHTFKISFDKKLHTSVEIICKSILQAVRARKPYELITDEEYEEELLSLIIYFTENCASNFPHLNKKGTVVIKTLKNTIKKSDSLNAFDWECETETVELVCDKNKKFYIVITVESTTAENNGRPSTRRNVKKFETNITFLDLSEIKETNYENHIISEFITLLYSKQATAYDMKEIKLYKKCKENGYCICLYGTAYNAGGTLYFDLENDYFRNHSIEDFCDFVQKKCIWNNEDYFSDYREVIKQNHTILKLFKGEFI